MLITEAYHSLAGGPDLELGPRTRGEQPPKSAPVQRRDLQGRIARVAGVAGGEKPRSEQELEGPRPTPEPVLSTNFGRARAIQLP